MAKPKPTLPRVPEKAEQAHIVQLLRSLGAKVYVLGHARRRGDFPGTMQTPGLPDLLAFIPDGAYQCCVTVECKAAGGRLRPEQRHFQQLCEAAGNFHIVGGLDAAIAWLAEHHFVKASAFPHYRQPEASQS